MVLIMVMVTPEMLMVDVMFMSLSTTQILAFLVAQLESAEKVDTVIVVRVLVEVHGA